MAYKDVTTTYKETQIKTASQGQLIIMLYDAAIRHLNSAIDILKLKDNDTKFHDKIETLSKSVMKAEEIITELMVYLDFEQGGEISQNLFSIYSWFNKELMEANIAQDVKRMIMVKDQLVELRNSWNEILGKAKTESVQREAVGLNIAG